MATLSVDGLATCAPVTDFRSLTQSNEAILSFGTSAGPVEQAWLDQETFQKSPPEQGRAT